MNMTWQPYRKYTRDYLEIDGQSFLMKERYRQHQVHFWNDYINPMLARKTPEPSSLAGTGQILYGDVVIPRWTLTLLCALLGGCVIILIVVFVKVVKAKPRRLPSTEQDKSEVAQII